MATRFSERSINGLAILKNQTHQFRMPEKISDTLNIDFPSGAEIIPVFKQNASQKRSVKIIRLSADGYRNYQPSNRKGFYKILYIPAGSGLVSVGARNYYINEPAIFFIHPDETISWRTEEVPVAFTYSFKKELIDENPDLKCIIDATALFTDVLKSAIQLSVSNTEVLDKIFKEMSETAVDNEDAVFEARIRMQLQSIIQETLKSSTCLKPVDITDDFKHVHDFFRLLEKEMACISYNTQVQIKTVKEFARKLLIHPNHLNTVLKKHTGQNASTHLKNRLLEESKSLLLNTNWDLQDIGYAIGFADQPNFSQFFKKNTGITPAAFRNLHFSDEGFHN